MRSDAPIVNFPWSVLIKKVLLILDLSNTSWTFWSPGKPSVELFFIFGCRSSVVLLIWSLLRTSIGAYVCSEFFKFYIHIFSYFGYKVIFRLVLRNFYIILFSSLYLRTGLCVFITVNNLYSSKSSVVSFVL